MTKEEIRTMIRSQKRSLSITQITSSEDAFLSQISGFAPYREAKELYCYASYNQELPTYGLIKKALEEGKKVALPKVEGEEITFYYITSCNDLNPGYQGIPEPVTTRKAEPSISLPAFMLLPGLAFTTTGKRLGYGGGFYDRYLDAAPNGSFTTCAIGYSFQVMDELPVEEHDKRVDYVVTPESAYECRPSNTR